MTGGRRRALISWQVQRIMTFGHVARFLEIVAVVRGGGGGSSRSEQSNQAPKVHTSQHREPMWGLWNLLAPKKTW